MGPPQSSRAASGAKPRCAVAALLHPEIYTIWMGNCSPDRLKKLFGSLSLPEPFSGRFGQNAQLKAYFSDRARGRVADRASEALAVQFLPQSTSFLHVRHRM